MTRSRRKTLVYIAVCAALLAVAVFWAGTPQVHAAGPVVDNVRNLASRVLGGAVDIGIALAMTYVVLLLVFEVASYILAFAGLFLDVLFDSNILLTPGTNPAVLAGWTALRDVANGLFILIVLWIAITIIFNLDNLGGKKLLVRVIVVALLINFSLLMASTVFAFANQLALPFARALRLDPYNPEEGVTLSTIFMKETKIQTLAKVIRDEGATEQFRRSVQQAATTSNSPTKTTGGTGTLWAANISPSLGIPPPIPTAQADLPSGVAAGGTCLQAAGILNFAGWIPAAVCGVVGIAVGAFVNVADVASVAGPTAGAIAGWVLTPYINIAVADIVLVVTAAAFFSAAVLLAVRYIAMIFIGVFAPIAFLSLVVPRYGERIWSMWLDNLLRWAFVAPIFYFLMYLSVYMLQAISAAQSSFTGSEKIAFQGNALYIFSLVIFLVFLWASIFLTRRAAGMGAEAALTFTKKLAGVGLGIGTGLAARKVLPWMGQAATGLQEKINQRSPLLRSTFGRGLTAFGLGQATRASRKQLADRQAAINQAGWTSAEIQQRLASGYFKSPTDVAAAIGVLKSRGDLDKQGGVEGYDKRHLETAADVYRGLKTDLVPLMRADPTIAKQGDFSQDQFNLAKTDGEMHKALKEIAPDLTDLTKATDEQKEKARQTAIERLAWRRVRPSDVDTMDLNILDDDNNKRRFLEMASGEHLSKLGRRDTNRARSIQEFLERKENEPLWNSFDNAKKKYFRGGASTSIGIWKVPAYAAKDAGSDTSGDDDDGTTTT